MEPQEEVSHVCLFFEQIGIQQLWQRQHHHHQHHQQRILFIELGLVSTHDFSFLIWDINIMAHWYTLILLISHLCASDVDWTIIPGRGYIACITLGDTGPELGRIL